MKKNPEWLEFDSRLKIDKAESEIVITKSRHGKRTDLINSRFIAITILLLAGFISWDLMLIKNYNLEYWYFLLMVPFLIVVAIGMTIDSFKLKDEQIKKKEIIINKMSHLRFKVDDTDTKEDQIKAVNLYFQEDQEIGNHPQVCLELKLDSRSVLEIDSERNYLELLRSGNEICNFLNLKLNVFSGRSPYKNRIKL
ncbi:MAG: hypothetical protein AB8F74_16265 [Saprospiraceae bacterium]